MELFMSIKEVIMIFSVAALASCNNPCTSNKKANNYKSKQPIVKNIRTDTTGFWNEFHNVRQLSRQLKLNPVDKGFDSLQIRVWFSHSLGKRKHLVIIERQNCEWKGRLYEMNVGYVDTLNYNLVERYNKKNVKPVSGWQQFISELYQYKILELSGNNGGGTDGMNYCIEILTAGTYTYYSFDDPEPANDQSANMVNIITLLEREFKFNALKG
jgi:hypothetical protein